MSIKRANSNSQDDSEKSVKVVKLNSNGENNEDTSINTSSNNGLEISDDEEEDTYQNQSLYLETIRRPLLDFDFETRCSVSLLTTNIYACLVCGKYFQGRGPSSHAYFHSVDSNHHVFMNLNTLKVYVLPEGYQVDSNTLNDIKAVANPTYNSSQIANLDKSSDVGTKPACYDLNHKEYTQGFIGLNNIKHNDYANVIFQMIAHVKPIRDFFLSHTFSKSLITKPTTPGSAPKTVPYQELAKSTSLLLRKIWNPNAFKAHVSPHDILQHISVMSSKRFTSDIACDPFDFMVWYINYLHLALGGSPRVPNSSLIHKTFQGRLVIETQKVTTLDTADGRKEVKMEGQVSIAKSPFLFLSLDLPPIPLFKSDPYMNGSDGRKDIDIPQVMLTSLLSKYDGVKVHELAGLQKKYKIEKLPKLLVFHIKRFEKDSVISKRNQTVVVFDPRKLDMRPYVQEGYRDEANTVNSEAPINYRLIANIVHESGSSGNDQLEDKNVNGERSSSNRNGIITNKGGPGSTIKSNDLNSDSSMSTNGEESVWKTQLFNKSKNEWTQIQDLIVTPVKRELLFLSESYIQVWEKTG